MHIDIAGHSAYTERSSVHSLLVYLLVVHPRFSVYNRKSQAQRTFWLGFDTVCEAGRFQRAINKIHKDERLRFPTFFLLEESRPEPQTNPGDSNAEVSETEDSETEDSNAEVSENEDSNAEDSETEDSNAEEKD